MNISNLLANIKFGEMEYIDFAGLLFASIEPITDSHKELAAIFSMLDSKNISNQAKQVIIEYLIIPPSLEKSIKRLSKLNYKNKLSIYMKVYSILSISPLNNAKEEILSKIRTGFRISKKEDKGLRTDFVYIKNKLAAIIFKVAPELSAVFGPKRLGFIGTSATVMGLVSNLALFTGSIGKITRILLFFAIGYFVGSWLKVRRSEQLREETKKKAEIAITRLELMIKGLNIKLQELEEISNLAWYKEYYDRIKKKIRDIKNAKNFYENLHETCL